MNGKQAKKLRKEINRVSTALSLDALMVLLEVMGYSFRNRMKIAWLIVKGR